MPKRKIKNGENSVVKTRWRTSYPLFFLYVNAPPFDLPALVDYYLLCEANSENLLEALFVFCLPIYYFSTATSGLMPTLKKLPWQLIKQLNSPVTSVNN